MSGSPIVFGIDQLIADDFVRAKLRHARIGLLSNAASYLSSGSTTLAAMARTFGVAGVADGGAGLARLFSPEHGWRGQHGAGDRVADEIDPVTGLPVHSLYGARPEPDAAALADLDAVVVDLPDVGVRCYTYAATAAIFIQAALAQGVAVYPCDRPNPLGSDAAGPRPDDDLRGLLAYFNVPFVHGLRLGGLLATLELTAAVPGFTSMAGTHLGSGDAPWHPPSPSLTHPDAVALYPGLVLLEGTNVSEGRGTDRPFRSFAAPWLDTEEMARDINQRVDFGVVARAGETVPRSGKFAGISCRAIGLSTRPEANVRGFALGLHIVTRLRRTPEFSWRLSGAPKIHFIDRLFGSRRLRGAVDAGLDADAIIDGWD